MTDKEIFEAIKQKTKTEFSTMMERFDKAEDVESAMFEINNVCSIVQQNAYSLFNQFIAYKKFRKFIESRET